MKRFLFRNLRKFSATMRKVAKTLGLSKSYHSLYNVFHGTVFDFLKPRGIIQVKSGSFCFHVSAEDRVMTLDLLTYGYWEKEEGEIIRSFLKPGMTFVDIGANFGYFSILAAERVGASGRVYAFEPEPRNFNLLLKNISTNHFERIIIPVQKALSDKPGDAELFLSKFNFGAHSLAESNVRQVPLGSVKVSCASLDGFFNGLSESRIDFIKMDTQGAEARIFSGAQEIIQKNQKLTILMEFWPVALQELGERPQELLRKLAGWGFGISVIEEGKCRKITDWDQLIATANKHTYVTLLLQR